MAYFGAMKKLTLLLLLLTVPAVARADEVVRAALYLTGADTPEELDSRLLEDLESLRSRPLPVNLASKARLLESGLLSPYQVAALEEYRSLSGDVLSFAELELVDGFGKEAVEILRPFLSLESSRNPGEAARDSARIRQSAILRATLKDISGKYRISAGRFEAAFAAKGESGTFYALYRLRKGKILLGDYNLRYGQGLAFWTSFQLAGLTTLEAFSRRPAGISPSWSYTRPLRGAAWDYSGRHLQLALFGSLDGTAGAHAGWFGRIGQAGMTVSLRGVSLDGRLNCRGWDFFGEAVVRNGSPAGLAGALVPLGRQWKGALQVRALPSAYSGKKNGEYGAALGCSFLTDDRLFKASWTADAALLPIPGQDVGRRRLKSTFLASWKRSDSWLWETRVNVSLPNYTPRRTDFRADATWTRDVWTVKGRLNGVCSGHLGVLGYLEGGWKPPGGCGWLRLTVFSTPDWQTRIYCYERDAPGNFTVPAYYGTGLSAMVYAGWKRRFRKTAVKLYVRASCLFRKEKPGQAGLKFQLMAER